MKKFWALILKKSRALSSIAIRIRGVHPKHLVEIREFWIKKYIKKDDVVLDLGCGNGQRDFKIARLCKSIIGVDYDEKSILDAKRNAKEKKITNIQFFHEDIFSVITGRVSVTTNKFDKIILLDVLEHIIDRKKLLSSIFSLLKDRGQLFVSVPNKNTSWKKLQKEVGVNYFTDPDHKIEYSKQEIKEELEKAGFKIIQMQEDVADTPWAPFFDLIGAFSLSLYKKCLEWKRRGVIKHPEETSGWEIVCIK